MIKRLDISGIHTELDKDIKKYAIKKISKLDNYMTKHVRKSIHGAIILEESMVKKKKQYTAEVKLFLPGEKITAKETTVNMYAAIDIVEEKLKTQLRKYKQMNLASSKRKGSSVRYFLGKIVRKKSSI
jgi:putative sigma-54 modulation protein